MIPIKVKDFMSQEKRTIVIPSQLLGDLKDIKAGRGTFGEIRYQRATATPLCLSSPDDTQLLSRSA